MPGDRLTTAKGLKPGDVVTVAVELADKQRPGHTYWWTRFACVADEPVSEHYVRVLSLKMRPDLDKDYRDVDIACDVVVKLEEHEWPQGVVAMRMKAIHMRWIDLEGTTPF